LIERFEGSLTADFQSVYTLRLADAVRDRTTDEVWDLVLWLPRGSCFRSEYEAGGDPQKSRELHGWTRSDQLGLNLLNVSRIQAWILAQSHSEKKIPFPEEVLGPWPNPKKTVSKKDDANAMARSLLRLQE
jgi:hypothetical protein